jgi:predicted Zn-dependent peptidase
VQKYVLSELDSGERVISEKVASVRSVSVGFWIGAGSRDERDDRAGVSHFIEHLLFKGSRSYDAQQIAETFDAMGAELNAATSREHTVVYSRVPDRHVDEALQVMTDMVFAPRFAELDQEREVVLEEIAMYEDTPGELVHDLFSEAVFGSHALGRPVIGTAGVISTVSRRAIAGYHRSMYTGANIVVSAAGNITHERLLALLESAERRTAEPPRAAPRARRPLVQTPAPGLRFQRKETEQYHLCLGAPGISRSDRRRFAASILDSILGGSASSRLFQEIREKRGMAYSVYSFASQYTDTGLIGVYVGTREENLAACVDICMEQIGDIAAGNLRQGELERAQESLKGRIMLSMESTSNRMSRLGKSVISDTELMTFDRIFAEIDAVDTEAVAELATVLLPPERLSASGVGPDEDRFRAAVERANSALVARAAA